MRLNRKNSGTLLSRVRQTRGVSWLATAFVTACLLFASVHTGAWGSGRNDGRHVSRSAAPGILHVGFALVDRRNGYSLVRCARIRTCAASCCCPIGALTMFCLVCSPRRAFLTRAGNGKYNDLFRDLVFFNDPNIVSRLGCPNATAEVSKHHHCQRNLA